MEREDRIKSIEKASKLIEEAACIIGDCISATEENRRFGDLPNKIRSLNTSDDGIENLLKHVKNDETDPLWTRPLASPKTFTRKDI